MPPFVNSFGGFFYRSYMSRLSIILGSKLPYQITFMIDKFTNRELVTELVT